MTDPYAKIPPETDRAQVLELVEQAKKLAVQYRQLTGKPLGITGEIAECEAAAILGLDLHAARTAGFDATETRDGVAIRVQIKGRVIANPKKIVGRVGGIDLSQPFDVVQLVLLDSDFDAFAIWEAERSAVESLITGPGSKARNERGSVGITQFRAIARLRWARP
jgi:hypothetical protein